MHGTQKTDRPLPGFVGGTLDRVDHVRTNPALLAEAFADPSARRLVLDGLDPVEADGHLLLEPIDRQALLADHVLLGVAIAFLFADMQARGAHGLVVLGDPAYYSRFGFENDPALRYSGAPAEYFQCLSFEGSTPAGEVAFAPAFSGSRTD